MSMKKRQDQIDVRSLSVNGTPVTASAADLNTLAGAALAGAAPAVNPVKGVAAGYKVARGTQSVTGSATIATGLTTVVSAVVSLGADAALTADRVSATISTTNIVVKVWKPTAADDCTPITSVTATPIFWQAVGT